jgi:hypothetical protein
MRNATDGGIIMFTKNGNKPLFPTAANTKKPGKKRKTRAKSKSGPKKPDEAQINAVAPQTGWFNPLWQE